MDTDEPSQFKPSQDAPKPSATTEGGRFPSDRFAPQPTKRTPIQKPHPPRQRQRPLSAHPEDEALEVLARSVRKPQNSSLSMIPSTLSAHWVKCPPRLLRHPQTRHQHHPKRNPSPDARNRFHPRRPRVGQETRPMWMRTLQASAALRLSSHQWKRMDRNDRRSLA